MKEIRGDILELRNNFDGICVTTNGVVKSNGRLVMGAGVAEAFRDSYNNLDIVLGDMVREGGNKCYLVGVVDSNSIISFPTKEDWRDNSSIELIKKSCQELMEIIEERGLTNVALPRPGCSNGGLNWSYVKEEIRYLLDDRVTIISL